ncbi:response regulator [Porifericola rhodea]|uniref:response regulator n=1 Tax=Porifericola rhodea TaxID=930972 RepID=UPI00266670BF|nr:response regulator [Porifericola rhodea]WKN30755.1 response regulator [Porifericola rhodea]
MNFPKSVLLIDDDEVNNFIISEWISENKPEVTFTIIDNVSDAIEYLKAQNDESFPQLILCDLRMPNYNGYDFLQHYETLFYPSNLMTQIIVMSAHLAKQDIEKLKAFQFITDTLIKETVQENFKKISESYKNKPASEG